MQSAHCLADWMPHSFELPCSARQMPSRMMLVSPACIAEAQDIVMDLSLLPFFCFALVLPCGRLHVKWACAWWWRHQHLLQPDGMKTLLILEDNWRTVTKHCYNIPLHGKLGTHGFKTCLIGPSHAYYTSAPDYGEPLQQENCSNHNSGAPHLQATPPWCHWRSGCSSW